jgi:hypothetical protein
MALAMMGELFLGSGPHMSAVLRQHFSFFLIVLFFSDLRLRSLQSVLSWQLLRLP